ncbi:unnamed protein product [Mytilus coruscus]|uniref:Uncharacterized protein n=1 Tax=Mytilus coruscus TaxID=42192 RepID=A0A6J8DTD6_MYTCO|nr:unnamed protein product [Mytilus coruscus]
MLHNVPSNDTIQTGQMTDIELEKQNVLTKVVIGKPICETVTYESVDTNQDQHIVPSSLGTDKPKSNLQAIKKDTGYSSKISQSSETFIKESQDLPSKNTMTSERKEATSISLPKINIIEAFAVRDDILKEVKSGQYKIKIAPSDLIDFGGQGSYGMTHQLFIQHSGTFVVMFDGSKDFHEPLKEYPTGDISNECTYHFMTMQTISFYQSFKTFTIIDMSF